MLAFHIDIELTAATSDGHVVQIPFKAGETVAPADLVSRWNAADSGSCLRMESVDSDPNSIRLVAEGNQSQVLFFVYAYDCIASLAPGSTETIDIRVLNMTAPPPLRAIDDLESAMVVVPADVAVLHITAKLFRKNQTDFYERHDIITLKKGIYAGRLAMTAALNDQVAMRGERNGTIYRFFYNAKYDVLGIEATHKQPKGSCVFVRGLCYRIGVFKRMSVPLRTKAKLQFEAPPAFVF